MERKYIPILFVKWETLPNRGNEPIDLDPGNGYVTIQDGTSNEMRIFPDRRWINGQIDNDQQAQTRRRVLVRVKLAPYVRPQSGQEIFLQAFDVDDPSSPHSVYDPYGAVDRDPDNRGPGSPDNREETAQFVLNEPESQGVEFIDPNDLTTVRVRTNDQGEATVVFEVSMRPGNNYRIVATTYRELLDQGVFIAYQRDPAAGIYLSQRVGIYNPGVRVKDDETTPEIFKASPALTVWRKLFVESDSMGTPSQGQQFAISDLMRNVPEPTLNILRDALRIAYISVERHPDPNVHQNNLPWRYAFSNNLVLHDYLLPQDPQQFRPWQTRDQHRADFWCVYIVGVYEIGLQRLLGEINGQPVERDMGTDPEAGEDDDGRFGGVSNDADNDPDVERVTLRDEQGNVVATGTSSALLGWTNFQPVRAPSVVGMETIRDMATQHGLDQDLIIALVVAHEVGHKFRLTHSVILNADGTDLMWVPYGDSGGALSREREIVRMRRFFWQDNLKFIRERDPEP